MIDNNSFWRSDRKFRVTCVFGLAAVAFSLGYSVASEASDISVIAQKKDASDALGIQCADRIEGEGASDQLSERKCESFRFIKLKKSGKKAYEVVQSGVPHDRIFSAAGLQVVADSIASLSAYRGVEVEALPLTLKTVGVSGMSVSYSWLSYLALPVDILTSPIHLPIQAIHSRSEGKQKEENGKQVRQKLLSVIKAQGGSTIGKNPSQLSAEQWDLVVKRIERCVDHDQWNSPIECSRE